MTIRRFRSSLCRWSIVLAITGLVAVAAWASPPHPELIDKTGAGKIAIPYFMRNTDDLHRAGVNMGFNPYEQQVSASAKGAVGSTAAAVEIRMLAVLVRFTDNPGTTGPTYFDDLLFDASGLTLRNYYSEASYGLLDIVTVDLPSSVGWTTAPQTYDYYVNGENGLNADSYPNNAQRMVEDVVDAIDGQVDFSDYDNNNNGFVDVLMIIHAGPGAEMTGSDDDIWSHQWQIYPRMTNDGVYVSNYTMQPEFLSRAGDMTIGVFAHELGHAFGLPDLYDTDYSSNGIGAWGVMGYGSWLGPNGDGAVPAFPCAWSRVQLGFDTVNVIAENVNSQAIEDAKSGHNTYYLWNQGANSTEFFLVENRQRSGYDAFLPNGGLLIWHVDHAMSSNDNEWYPGLDASQHLLVALEQADGGYDLEHASDLGDAADVFGTTGGSISFNALSSTTSDSYTDGPTMVAVQNVSAPSTIMYADFRVALAGGTQDDDDNNDDNQILPHSVMLSQNYPNPFNPMTTISFYVPQGGEAKVDIVNLMGQKITTVLDRTVSPGYTEVTWDGTDSHGRQVASGIYLYRLKTDDQQQVRKMVLLR